MRGCIFVDSCGEFPGIRGSLIRALGDAGCEAVKVPHPFRYLSFHYLYIGWMMINAIFVYGGRLRDYLTLTWAAQWAGGAAPASHGTGPANNARNGWSALSSKKPGKTGVTR